MTTSATPVRHATAREGVWTSESDRISTEAFAMPLSPRPRKGPPAASRLLPFGGLVTTNGPSQECVGSKPHLDLKSNMAPIYPSFPSLAG